VVRAIIVDDEQPARDRLKKLLCGYTDIEIISEATDGTMALEQVESLSPDIVFLDIEMPELNGLEVARTLGVNGPLIVFVTAYDEYALKAFESSAVDYIVKPINSKRLDFSIEKIRKNLSGQKNNNLEELFQKLNQANKPIRLAVRIGAKYEVFNPSDISAIIARDHYSTIIVGDKELLSEEPLEAVLGRLDNNLFLRVHRNAILNINYLVELKREGDRKFTAKLSDKRKTEIPISRERLPEIKKFLGLL